MRALEIRLHGRGGQGGVTCAKILAAVYAGLGWSVQSFGDYAGERSGAPVRAYTRVSASTIENRNKVYQPDHLLVLDPTLLGDDTVAGLAAGGILLLNTAEPLEAFAGRLERFRLAVVDATSVARRHGIGTRSVVIVNTTIAGAFVRAAGIPLSALEDAYRHLGFTSNLPAAKEAFDAVRVRDAVFASEPAKARVVAASPPVIPLVEHTSSPRLPLVTGDWRTQTPRYQKHLAPCHASCPAGNDVVGFVQALARGDEAQAADVLARTTPLPGVCGYVCPAPCMEACNRRALDAAVNVRALERGVAAAAQPRGALRGPAEAAPRGRGAERFAVVGGGPAGIAAAHELARRGQRVTIFEAEEQLGGVLRTGIPAFRLPREVLDRDIDRLLRLDVETRLGERLDAARVAALAGEFDAVILATGLQELRGLDVPGAALAGIEQGIAFLHRANGGQPRAEVSGHVVVLGGGNTAVDCARTALRAGAAAVTLAYRRSRVEMPAIPEEVELAEGEGVRFVFLRAPVGFAAAGERASGVELSEVELGPPDETGRRRPLATERRAVLACDMVLLALGQTADLSLLPSGWGLRDGRVHCDGRALPVFAAGDLSTGEGTVAHAIGDGRRAAGLAMRALGFDVVPFQRPERTSAVTAADIRMDHFGPVAPSEGPAEARRCFSCGDCTHCDTCLVFCPEGVIHRKGGGYEIDPKYCKGCGICVAECPRRAMEMYA